MVFYILIKMVFFSFNFFMYIFYDYPYSFRFVYRQVFFLLSLLDLFVSLYILFAFLWISSEWSIPCAHSIHLNPHQYYWKIERKSDFKKKNMFFFSKTYSHKIECPHNDFLLIFPIYIFQIVCMDFAFVIRAIGDDFQNKY